MPTTMFHRGRKPLAILDLRMHHREQDPAAFCERVGLSPRISWTAGAPRRTPKGALLKGVYRESYCSCPIAQTEIALLDFALRKLVERLEPHRRFLSRFSSTGGKTVAYVSLYADQNAGVPLEFDLLGALGRLHLGLSLDLYPWRRKALSATQRARP